MNLSPWFQPSEPPVRYGWYQVKNWVGHIRYLEWLDGVWWDGAQPVPERRICAWRGVVR